MQLIGRGGKSFRHDQPADRAHGCTTGKAAAEQATLLYFNPRSESVHHGAIPACIEQLLSPHSGHLPSAAIA